MPGSDLAGVQRAREDLLSGDANLDTSPDQVRVERIVIGIEAQGGTGGTRSTQRRSQSGAAGGPNKAGPSGSSHRRSSSSQRTPSGSSSSRTRCPAGFGSARSSRLISSLNGRARDLRWPLIGQRLVPHERSPDRVAVHPGPSMNLADAQPAYEVQAAHLRPLLHSDRPSSRARSAQTNPGSAEHRTVRWSRLQPAQVAQVSPGADTVIGRPLFRR